jgi:3-deoxy-manno-octulosonate cytidylyltransferase (CMP-KDO synthetase)
MTPESCLTGTDRVYQVSKIIDADIYINIQGDEPLIDFNDILQIISLKKIHFHYVINGMTDILENEDHNNINIPKVLVNKNNKLIYISRLPIPGIKKISSKNLVNYKKQVCIYAFNKKELALFGNCKFKAKYESFEDIEILRFFDLEIPIKMVKINHSSLAIDCHEDVKAVEDFLIEKEGKCNE